MIRLYRWLLSRLLPDAFVREYGSELHRSVEARLLRTTSQARRFFLFLRELVDLVRTAVREWADELHVRPVGAGRSLEDLGGLIAQEVAAAGRGAIRTPRFTILAVVMIGVGVGSSAAVYGIVEHVLFTPLPFERPDELVMIWPRTEGEEPSRRHLSLPNVESLGAAGPFTAVAGLNTSSASVTGLAEAEVVPAARATRGLMAVLGAAPLMGRDLEAADARRDAPRVVVVSHGFWQTRLAGRPDVLGRDLHLFEDPYRIVGVAPPGFDYPEESMLWLPFGVSPDGCGRDCAIVERAVGRLRPGVTTDEARSGLQTLAAGLAAAYPAEFGPERGFRIESMLDYEVGDVRSGLLLTLAAVGLVLFIVCTNTAVLLLARAAARRREVAVRVALGASWPRLLVHLTAETCLLAGGGGLLGWILATGVVAWIGLHASELIPRVSDVAVDISVMSVLIGIVVIAAFGIGLGPARYIGKRLSRSTIAPGARRSGASGDSRSRAVLMACEVALCVVSLAAAGLVLTSVRELDRVDMGFDGTSVTRFTLVPPVSRYPERSDLVDLFQAVEREIGDLASVEQVGSVFGAPLTTDRLGVRVSVEGTDAGDGEVVVYRPVTAGYFAAMGVPVVAGRALRADATLDVEPEAVINQSAALALFGPDRDPLGQVVQVSSVFGDSSARVVGIVGDVRRNIVAEPTPAVYPHFPTIQPAWRGLVVHVRGRPGHGDLENELRLAVARVDPDLVAALPERVAEARRRETLRPRVFGGLLTAFALIAVLLAGTGLYGAIGFLVSQRTAEIGVRMALGAGRHRVVGLVAGQGLLACVFGLTVGLATVALGGHVLDSLLFGVTPNDPRVMGLVTAVVVGVVAMACWTPVRRATRIDPTEAMRAE